MRQARRESERRAGRLILPGEFEQVRAGGMESVVAPLCRVGEQRSVGAVSPASRIVVFARLIRCPMVAEGMSS